MNLQNGYKVLYEKVADGKRAFFADKLDGTAATQIGDAIEIGKYRLVYEKDGQIYGSETGKVEDGVCLNAFDEIFKLTNESEPVVVAVEDEEPDDAEGNEDELEDESGDEAEPEVEE